MDEPSPIRLISDRQDRMEKRVDRLAKETDEIREQLVVVPVMKRAFYWLAVVITGAIVAVVGSAIGIILSTGGPR